MNQNGRGRQPQLFHNVKRGGRTATRLGVVGILLPLAFVSPTFSVGHYSVGALDLFMLSVMLIGVLRGVPIARPIGSPIGYFMAILMVAWGLSTLNGYRFNVHFAFSDVVFFYRLAFYFAAWFIGYHSRESINQITSSRLSRLIIACVVLFAAIYPFLSYSARLDFLSHFWSDKEELADAVTFDRFPGIGTNINIYSFIPVAFLIFSFHTYMYRKGGILIPLLCMVLIVAGGSRKSFVSAMLVVSALYVWSKPFIRAPIASDPTATIGSLWHGGSVWRKRSLVGFALLVVGIGMTDLMGRGLLGARLSAELAPEKFASAARYRARKMEIGLRRIALAPVLGIPDPAASERPRCSVYVNHRKPHNEFIQIWMWYGVLGLFAHFYLIGRLLMRNIRCKTGPAWVLFYLAVIIQMLLDTGFKAYQFSAVFFIVAGMNWRNMEDQYLRPNSRMHQESRGRPSLLR